MKTFAQIGYSLLQGIWTHLLGIILGGVAGITSVVLTQTPMDFPVQKHHKEPYRTRLNFKKKWHQQHCCTIYQWLVNQRRNYPRHAIRQHFTAPPPSYTRCTTPIFHVPHVWTGPSGFSSKSCIPKFLPQRIEFDSCNANFCILKHAFPKLSGPMQDVPLQRGRSQGVQENHIPIVRSRQLTLHRATFRQHVCQSPVPQPVHRFGKVSHSLGLSAANIHGQPRRHSHSCLYQYFLWHIYCH